MPFKTYYNWLFDGNKDSPIPAPRTDDNGKVIVPDILKYNSPITNQYVISVFLKNLHLNKYLDQYFNNSNIYALPREELLYFIKQCVLEFRVGRYDTVYYKRNYPDKLYVELEKRYPQLKSFEIDFLCQKIKTSKDRDHMYHSLGLELPKKQKIKTKKKKVIKKSLKDFMAENFSMIEI
jgi:hypothetical protein